MKRPLVSIGFPVYNGEASLGKAIDSILSQDFEDFELVISDNASTDGTGDISRSYASRDRRIRYHRNETNCGINPNHDRAFQLSGGRYFMWAAHDVELLPGMLKQCAQTMEKAPDSVVLAYPRCEMIRDGQLLPADDRQSIASQDPRPCRRLLRVIHRVLRVNQLYGLIRSEALAKTQLNGLYPSSDYVLLAELAMLGEIWEIPATLLRRRIDSDRGTAAVCGNPKAWQAWMNPHTRIWRDRLPYRERLALEYLRAAWRAPLKPGAKLQCLLSILPAYYARMSRPGQFLMNATRPLRHCGRSSQQTPSPKLSPPPAGK